MNNIFRGLIAGYGAKKLGGGCFSTILVFILIWVLLGQCNESDARKTQNAQVDHVIQVYASSGIALTNSPIAFGMAER